MKSALWKISPPERNPVPGLLDKKWEDGAKMENRWNLSSTFFCLTNPAQGKVHPDGRQFKKKFSINKI
jgi:hypothetical protein